MLSISLTLVTVSPLLISNSTRALHYSQPYLFFHRSLTPHNHVFFLLYLCLPHHHLLSFVRIAKQLTPSKLPELRVPPNTPLLAILLHSPSHITFLISNTIQLVFWQSSPSHCLVKGYLLMYLLPYLFFFFHMIAFISPFKPLPFLRHLNSNPRTVGTSSGRRPRIPSIMPLWLIAHGSLCVAQLSPTLLHANLFSLKFIPNGLVAHHNTCRIWLFVDR